MVGRMVRKRKRVRLHLVDRPGAALPSVEGILLARRASEYWIGEPQLLIAAGASPTVLSDAKELRVPSQNVAFYEVLRP